jgi:RNA polymerase sigma-70 factor (ECF subfamily)
MTGSRITPLADSDLLERSRAGDEESLLTLMGRYHGALVRIALCHVQSRSTAEEVAREAWRTLVAEPDNPGDRCSLKTRMFRVVLEAARSRADDGDSRAAGSATPGARGEPAIIGADRFLPPGHRWAGHWSTPPLPFPQMAGDARREGALACVRAALDGLDDRARLVVTLRDVCGWNADEVWEAIGSSPPDQRTLLHRARARIRGALETHHARERTGVR